MSSPVAETERIEDDDYAPVIRPAKLISIGKIPPSPIDMDSLAAEIEEASDPLEQIAYIARRMTYGKFIELSAGLGVDPAIVWKWATR